MALTTQISEQFEGPYVKTITNELRRAGCDHLTVLKRAMNHEDWNFVWVWRTRAGNTGHYVTEEPKPTSEELTAMFAAIKLTD